MCFCLTLNFLLSAWQCEFKVLCMEFVFILHWAGREQEGTKGTREQEGTARNGTDAYNYVQIHDCIQMKQRARVKH